MWNFLKIFNLLLILIQKIHRIFVQFEWNGFASAIKTRKPRHQYECVSLSINNYFENMYSCCADRPNRLRYSRIALCFRLRCGGVYQRRVSLVDIVKHSIRSLRDVVVNVDFLRFFTSSSSSFFHFWYSWTTMTIYVCEYKKKPEPLNRMPSSCFTARSFDVYLWYDFLYTVDFHGYTQPET